VTVKTDDARRLVIALAAVGGDPDEVRRLLLALVEDTDRDALLLLALTALGVVFSECLDRPVYPTGEQENAP
jgi:hypothetical protein